MQSRNLVVAEPGRNTPVLAEVDVLVVGGGAAGVAAACAAAESGTSVLLVERYGFCGGAAVAGLSGTICGLFTASSSGKPQQIVFGFADRFARAMQERGGVTEPVRYGKTMVLVHDPLVWRETADAFLTERKVQILYHAVCVDAVVSEGRIRGVLVETKEGRGAILAGVVIDCSGDGDVAHRAGVPYSLGKDGQVQNPTMIFRMMGVDVPRMMQALGGDTIVPHSISKLIEDLNAGGDYRLPRSKVFLFPTPRAGEILCNATRVTGAGGRELNCAFARDLTEAELEGRKQIREYARFFRSFLPGFERAFVNDTGVQVGVRQTRSIQGHYVLKNDDVVSGTKFKKAIARSPWPIELHSGEKPRLVWLEDDYYEIPYECLIPRGISGLIFAGRCLSAEHEAMASARVTAQCFSMGEAAGLAAALAVKDNRCPATIDGAEVRELLASRDPRA